MRSLKADIFYLFPDKKQRLIVLTRAERVAHIQPYALNNKTAKRPAVGIVEPFYPSCYVFWRNCIRQVIGMPHELQTVSIDLIYDTSAGSSVRSA